MHYIPNLRQLHNVITSYSIHYTKLYETDSGIIFVTAIGAVFAVTINTYTGVKNINPHYIEAARNMGAKGTQLVTNVLIPAAFPYMISGFKQGWAFAWRGVIGAELLFSFLGLGFLLNVGRQLNDVV